jgi:hypothetical protein
MLRSLNRPDILVTTLAAAGILMVTMGTRQSLGLFIAPIDESTGFGIAAISLALAIGQFTWGRSSRSPGPSPTVSVRVPC